MLDSIYIRSTLSQPHCRSTDAFGIEDFEYISSRSLLDSVVISTLHKHWFSHSE